eukprot:scaffold19696_cov128-Isochrysis_galbana.AAC.1
MCAGEVSAVSEQATNSYDSLRNFKASAGDGYRCAPTPCAVSFICGRAPSVSADVNSNATKRSGGLTTGMKRAPGPCPARVATLTKLSDPVLTVR